MAVIDHREREAAEGRSREALALAHRWLIGPDDATLVEMARDLAAAFGATGAGVASLTDGVVLVREPATVESPLPWTERPGLLIEARQTPGGVMARSSHGVSFLCAVIRTLDTSEWLLWVEHPTQEWTAAEGAALALAGQAAGRHLGKGNTEESGVPVWVRQLEHATAQQRLEEAALLTRRLAHDYGNVLTSILGFTELSLSQLPGESSLKRYLNEVYRGAQQGALLTARLRLFARRPPPSAQTASLAPVIAEQQSRLAAQGSEVALDFDVPSDLPPVALAFDTLQEVLGPVLDNAWEAAEVRGDGREPVRERPARVTLTARTVQLSAEDCLDLWGSASPGPYVQVEVTDTGCGLTPDAESRLFHEPFFTNKPRHRGLGLATVYGVLRAHKGGFRLSPGPAGGVTASVFLPIATAAPTQTGPGRVENADPNRQILVVDDDPGVLAMISDTLRRVGYRVQTATSAAEAIEKHAAARNQSFGLVLSDVIMQPTSGVEMARQLLARDTNLRLLFMSGQVSQEIVRQELGGDGVELLAKPFRIDRLLQAVRQALGSPPRGVRFD